MSTDQHTSSFSGHLSSREAANTELAIRAARGMFTLSGASLRWFVASWLFALSVGAILFLTAPPTPASKLQPATNPIGAPLRGPAWSVPMPQPNGTARRQKIGLVPGQTLPVGARKVPGSARAYKVVRPLPDLAGWLGRRFLLPLLAGLFALAAGLALARRKPSTTLDEDTYPAYASRNAFDVLDGMPFGVRETDKHLMVVPRESLRTHLLLVGATGTGKTYNVILPLMRHSAEKWKGLGMIAFDFTGNLPLEDEGLFDYILDPSAIARGGKSDHWNAFADPNVEVLLQGLFPKEETDRQLNYWATNNATIIRTFHLAIHTLGEVPTARMMHSYSTDQSELVTLRERYSAIVHERPTDPGHKQALLNLRQMCELGGQKFKDMMGGVSGILSEVSTGAFGEMGDRSDFNLAEALLGGKRIGVRLKQSDFPAGLRYARLFLGSLKSIALSLPPADHLRCLLMIDEYPQYKTTLGDFLALTRQFGVGVVLTAQTVSQLRKLSDDQTGVYTSNARSIMVATTTAGDDAKFWQSEFGAQLEVEQSRRVSHKAGGTHGWVTGRAVSVDSTFREVERPIIYARDLQSRNQKIVYRLNHNRLADRAVWIDPSGTKGKERRFRPADKRRALERVAELEAARKEEIETLLPRVLAKPPMPTGVSALGGLVSPEDGTPLVVDFERVDAREGIKKTRQDLRAYTDEASVDEVDEAPVAEADANGAAENETTVSAVADTGAPVEPDKYTGANEDVSLHSDDPELPEVLPWPAN